MTSKQNEICQPATNTLLVLGIYLKRNTQGPFLLMMRAMPLSSTFIPSFLMIDCTWYQEMINWIPALAVCCNNC